MPCHEQEEFNSSGHVNVVDIFGSPTSGAVICGQSNGGIGIFVCVWSFTQLLDSSLVRLAAAMADERRFGVKPLGAFNTIIPTQTRQIFWCLGVLVEGKVLCGKKIVLDLIDVSGFPPRLGECALVSDTHFC